MNHTITNRESNRERDNLRVKRVFTKRSCWLTNCIKMAESSLQSNLDMDSSLPRAEVRPFDTASDQGSERSESVSEKPWRDTHLDWDEKEYEKLRQQITSHSPMVEEPKNYNILLVGQIGSGKSSIINTMFSAMRNELGQLAFNAQDDQSTTKRFRSYKLRESVKSRAVNVTLHDTMGFEGTDGPSLNDLEYIMDGHIKDGYTFKHRESISYNSPFFRKEPKASDKMHVVVLVLDSVPLNAMAMDVCETLRQVTRSANDREIRWCVTLTKIDDACPLVYDDLTGVFTSSDIGECVECAHNLFGCLQSSIFPIQNYASLERVHLPINILALFTLENILRIADNTMETQNKGAYPVDKDVPEKVELLKKPWRENGEKMFQKYDELFKKLVDTSPRRVGDLNVCLVGPVGSGKSSFINSVLTTFYGRVMTTAETGQTANPVTSHYREYKLRQGRAGAELKIKLIDTMGFMSHHGGIMKEDINTILDGKVENSSPLNPIAPVEGKHEVCFPLKERMHALILIVDGSSFSAYDDGMIDKMKTAMAVAKGHPREIPRIILVSHLDRVCEHVSGDPAVVFRSQRVKECLQEVHEKLMVPMVDIWPVCNYYNETAVDEKKSCLVLQTLDHVVERAQDYIANAPEEEWEKPRGFMHWMMSFIGWKK